MAIITLGESGVVFCENDSEPIFIKSKKVDVKSTHGAGDVFAGVLCSSLSSGLNLISSVKIANEKAALHVSSVVNINKKY